MPKGVTHLMSCTMWFGSGSRENQMSEYPRDPVTHEKFRLNSKTDEPNKLTDLDYINPLWHKIKKEREKNYHIFVTLIFKTMKLNYCK